MNVLRYTAVTVLESLLRMMPIATKTGLIRIGNPDRSSPVFLTCNYHLTVEKVKRVLEGMDAYLLVANSRGINVWCAAAGGLFTNHDVISALKTTGIEELVEHRNVILPQFAAAGVEATLIQKKTGWKVLWGPVYAEDIPRYAENQFEKTPKMKEVEFPLAQRIDMAAAWAFPISVIVSLILLLFWRAAVVPTVFLVWGLSFLLFISFPLYEHRMNPGTKRTGFVFFDFGRGELQLILLGLLVAGFICYSITVGEFSWGFVLRWSVISLVIVVVLSMDLMGSTPTYKSGLHEDRLLNVIIDKDKCKGVGFCEQVCPRNCYELDKERKIAAAPRAERCVQCGACIIQCPFDALYFRTPTGDIIPPDQIRRFKLNLMGKRTVGAKD